MPPPATSLSDRRPWPSLWTVAFLSFLGQLALCQFFSFGEKVPVSLDLNPSNLWKVAYHFPPTGEYLTLNWLGLANLPPPLNPYTLGAHLPPWLFFTAYAPLMSTLALLAMAAFLRELGLVRPAALFGGVVLAWQGDILSFIFPGHYGYITLWPFLALAAWAALRGERTGNWAYALISGACCGTMVGLQPDRGAIACLLIAAFYLAPIARTPGAWRPALLRLVLCAAVALMVSLAAFLALFQSYIVGVHLGGETNRAQSYSFATQFSLGPEETLTYLVPGFFGWHTHNASGPYWGSVGQTPEWTKTHQGSGSLNLAISTTGTVAAILAMLGLWTLLPTGPCLRENRVARQLLFGRMLAGLGLLALVLGWGYHSPLYGPLFQLPLMDKWRDPVKWLEVTDFALVTLSALGVHHFLVTLELPPSPLRSSLRRRIGWFMGGWLVLLSGGFVLSFPLTIALAGHLQASNYDSGSIANAMGMVHLSVGVALGLTILACLLFQAVWRPELLRRWKLVNPWLQRGWDRLVAPQNLSLALVLGLILLVVVQLGWVALPFIQPMELDYLTQTNPLLDALKSEDRSVRVSVEAHDPTLNTMLQNQFTADDISSVDISAASRIPDAFSAFRSTLNKNQARYWLLAGVKNVAIPQQALAQLQADPGIVPNIERADGYVLQATASPNLPSHALVRLRDYFAKATLISHAEILPSDDALLQRLKDPGWNPRESILLSGPPPAPAAPGWPAGASAAGIDLETYTPHDIRLRVQAPDPAYVLINDQYDPDWQVRVNGQPAPLLRADYLLRAIAVPAGASDLELHYTAHYRVAGQSLPVVAVNLFSDGALLAAWLIAGVNLWRRREARGASIAAPRRVP